jgi:uncharacterized phiE125 gp8 family phage protein
MTVDITKIKTYLGISVSTHDTVLTNLMTAVCAFIENVCDRVFNETTYTEEIYSGGEKIIFLKKYPVSAVSKVEYKSGSNSNPTWTEFTEDDYDLVDGRRLIRAGGWAPGVNTIWPSGYNNIRITYTAGYSSNPADLEQLIIELVAKKFNQRKSDGIGSESAEGASLDWSRALTPEQKIVLSKFKKISL